MNWTVLAGVLLKKSKNRCGVGSGGVGGRYRGAGRRVIRVLYED